MDAVPDNLPDVAPQHELAQLPPLGALPLRNQRHERFARLIATLIPKGKAYLEAFEMDSSDMTAEQLHCAQGNASRLEKHKAVQARIAWLSRQQEELLAQKRERLEAWQWTILEHNPAQFYEIAERPLLDGKGKPVIDPKTDEFVMIKYQRAKFLSDLSQEALAAVEGLQITDSGKVMIKTYSKMQAHDALRKMLGVEKLPMRSIDDVGDMSTAEIVAELQTLGVDVRLSVSVTR